MSTQRKLEETISRRGFLRAVGYGAVAAGTVCAVPENWLQAAESVAETKAGMNYRVLGRTGLKVSEVVMGCGRLEADKGGLVLAALDGGINYFDTGASYQRGQSEETLGRVLSDAGKRDQVIIATKASGLPSRDPDISSEEAEATINRVVEESLRRLQTDYIDILFAPHGADSPEQCPPDAWREPMEKLKKDGKVRFLALSTHTNYTKTSMAAIESGFYDVVMLPINVLNLEPELLKRALSAAPSGPAQRKSMPGKKQLSAKMGKRPSGGSGRIPEDIREILAPAKEKNIGLLAMKAAHELYIPLSLEPDIRELLSPNPEFNWHQMCYRYVLDRPENIIVNVAMGANQHVEDALAIVGKKLKAS